MATNFMFKVTQVLKRNPNGSYATQAERKKVLKLVDRNLKELGYNKLELHNLGSKHLNVVIGMWMSNGLSTGTIKNRVAHLRWLLEKIGKPGVLPSSNTNLGIPKRVYVTNQDKSIELKEEQLNLINNPYLQASFRLQVAFGLRREESMKIRLKEADKGQFLRLVQTKGARPRDIPITTRQQRELLDELKSWVGAGSLIPPESLYSTQLGACIKMGIDRAHGLRHAYAQKRYLEMVGFPCPAKGGPKRGELPSKLYERVKEIRTQISEELGHGREEVTAVYLGR